MYYIILFRDGADLGCRLRKDRQRRGQVDGVGGRNPDKQYDYYYYCYYCYYCY